MPVREMTESDLKQVLEIQRELSFQDWNEAQFKAEIKASYALCVVYETESRPEAEMAIHPSLFWMGRLWRLTPKSLMWTLML